MQAEVISNYLFATSEEEKYKWVLYMPKQWTLQKRLVYDYVPMKSVCETKDRKQKINFLTFGDARMKASADRITAQALSMDIFDNIYVTNENNLSPDFVEKMHDRLIYGSRGFGYWCWKPQIILQTLQNMNDDDILLYVDVGCHLENGEIALQKFQSYITKINESKTGILVNEITQKEFQYTKGDLFECFGVYNDMNFTHTKQRCATPMFVKKTELTLKIIKEWLYFHIENFYFTTDAPSRVPNFEGFVENRHDQSVFSLISKKYDFIVFENKNEFINIKRDRLFDITQVKKL
jgi:hypothetical protein